MAVPDFQSLMLPFLQFTADGKKHTMPEVREALAKQLQLTKEDLAELLPSGRQTVFVNRASWAKAHLTMAGLLKTIKRGVFHITDRGIQVLQNPPAVITVKFLQQFPEFNQARQHDPNEDSASSSVICDESAATPEERLEHAHLQLQTELAQELLQQVKNNSWIFFEKLVVRLLVAMGYGGSITEAGQATQPSGDEGIDGIIKEDKLGLDVIYLQAKRWEGPVGRPEIQKFAGALQGQRAKKGVFITTSKFSQEAIDFAKQIESRIILIDGKELVRLMVDHNVGVSTVACYEVKKIDADFFTEE